jgi:phosphohistidine phosphatase
MLLYLIRHADALPADDDAVRPLSEHGRKQVRGLAKFLRGREAFAPAEIWHSPLVRARETARLLTAELRLELPHVQVPELEPEADPRAIARRAAVAKFSVAAFGHEPHLSALASLLIAGSMEPAVFVMKKCAVLALERVGSHWVVRWQVSPEVLG